MASALTTSWRAHVAVLNERNFRSFIVGYATSLFGEAMVPVALTFAVLARSGGTREVGYVLGAQLVPRIGLALFGGVIADRLPRKLIMITADLLRCGSELLLAVLLLTGHPPLWVFMVLAAVLGAGSAVFGPALSGLMPQVTSRERLQDANALRGLADSFSQIMGPAVAGILVATAGPGWAIGIDAVTYGISAHCLSRLQLPSTRMPVRESPWSQLRTGWREFRSRTWLWAVVVWFGLFHLLAAAPFTVLGAVVARDHFGGARAWGFILAARGIGALPGGLIALRLRPRRPLVVAMLCTMLFALPRLFLAVPTPALLIAAGTFVAGAGMAVLDTLWETTMQQQVPDDVLSRVSSYDGLGSFALVPLGYVLVGPVSAALGTGPTLWLAAVWIIVAGAGVLAVPAVRRCGGQRELAVHSGHSR
jgi:MFS family permease